MLQEYIKFVNTFDKEKKIKLLKLSLENYDDKTYKASRLYLFENIIRDKYNNYDTNYDVITLINNLKVKYNNTRINRDKYLIVLMNIFA
jgi:hypothetical protein